MKLKLLLRLVPLLFFLSLIGLNAQTPSTWVVDVNGTIGVDGVHFTSISAAIADAGVQNGDTIQVAAGTYNESFAIEKSLTIESIDGKATTIIELQTQPPATTYLGSIYINAPTVVLDGFTIMGSDDGIANITIGSSAVDVTISNNKLVIGIQPEGTEAGIGITSYYQETPYLTLLTVTNNTFEPFAAEAQRAFYINPGVVDFTFTNNVITGNFVGTAITQAQNALIDGNTLTGVGSVGNKSRGFGTWGYPDASVWGHTTFSNNTITNTSTAIGLYDAEGISIDNNVIDGNGIGIEILDYGTPADGTTIEIHNNSITNSDDFGISNTVSDLVNADNNWWGDASGPSGEGPGSGDLVSANTIYSPWLGNEPDAPHNEDNPWTFYVDDSNPDALDQVLSNPNLLDGDIIIADGGTYSAITIHNSITLQGINGATIENGSPAITIAANNVTVDGFTFNFDDTSFPYDDYAIFVSGDRENIVVKNCIFNNKLNGSSPGNAIDNNGGAGTHYVLAYEDNNWGDPSGPTHATNVGGIGGVITDYVIYEWDGLTSPINSISGISITPTFEWGAVGTWPQPTYVLIVSENSDLSAALYSKDVGTATEVTVTDTVANFPLSNNSKYYWSIDILDGASNKMLAPDTNYFYTVDDVTVSLSNPGDGTLVYLYDPLQFTWYLSQAQGSLRFLLQIKDTTAAPGAYEWENYSDFEYDNINSIYKSVNGLDGGTRYFWRVVAYYDDGTGSSGSFDWLDRVVNFSSVFYFDTKGGAVTAYPSWPVGGNLIYNLTPTFYWYTLQYEPSATYEVYYSTSGANTGGILDTYTAISAGSNLFVSVGTTLLPSQDYYWQVKTTYGTEVKYSSIAEFTTYDAPGLVPTAATPSYPTGGVEIYTQSPTFYWYIEGYNVDVNFTVEVDDDPGFGSIDFSFGTTQSTYIQGSGLVPGTTYHWRVRSSKSGYTDVLGPSASFSVAGGLGTAVVLSWPTGNPTLYSTTPTLSWYLDGSALGWSNYIVRWKKTNTSSDWSSDYDGTYSTSDMNETFYTFTSALEYGETYYWAVALYDGSTPVVDGDFVESSFTIVGGAGSAAIVLTVPANNATDISTSPSFYWYVSGSSLGIDKYQVTYSNTELFTANVVDLETTSTYVSTSGLDPGTTYWWYVSVSYDAGSTYTVASPTWKFTVDAGAMAVMPLVGSPANGVTISSHSPTLSWYLPAQSQSALSYEVELANNPDFSNATKYDNISQLNSQVTDLAEGEYYWRVRSKTSGSTSSYSNTGNFKIGSVTGVEGEEELPLSYGIEQNYPNPFNPTTTINYSLPEANYVTIKIYNMLGQEVKTLLSEEVKAGRHNVNWNGENNYGSKVSSGTYIYRITAGEYVQAKKMILLK